MGIKTRYKDWAIEFVPGGTQPWQAVYNGVTLSSNTIGGLKLLIDLKKTQKR